LAQSAPAHARHLTRACSRGAEWALGSQDQGAEQYVDRAEALLAGALADLFGMAWSIGAVELVTLASGLLVGVRMPETVPFD
jgi:hypothetical protein